MLVRLGAAVQLKSDQPEKVILGFPINCSPLAGVAWENGTITVIASVAAVIDEPASMGNDVKISLLCRGANNALQRSPETQIIPGESRVITPIHAIFSMPTPIQNVELVARCSIPNQQRKGASIIAATLLVSIS